MELSFVWSCKGVEVVLLFRHKELWLLLSALERDASPQQLPPTSHSIFLLNLISEGSETHDSWRQRVVYRRKQEGKIWIVKGSSREILFMIPLVLDSSWYSLPSLSPPVLPSSKESIKRIHFKGSEREKEQLKFIFNLKPPSSRHTANPPFKTQSFWYH